jgi:hypothetical protein
MSPVILRTEDRYLAWSVATLMHIRSTRLCFQVAAYRSERIRQLDLRLQRRNPPLGFPGRQVLLELFWLIGLGTERAEQVARMSAAICGIKDKVPDVATLIRATLAASGRKADIWRPGDVVSVPNSRHREIGRRLRRPYSSGSECSRKKRSISLVASGPRGSV